VTVEARLSQLKP